MDFSLRKAMEERLKEVNRVAGGGVGWGCVCVGWVGGGGGGS